MNKKLLSLAVAAGVASSSAIAAVDLTTTPQSAAILYATQLTATALAPLTLTHATAQDTTVEAGFAVDSDAIRFARFDLTGATLGTIGGTLTLAAGATASDIVETISAGGTITDSYVIFQLVAATTKSIASTTDLVLTLPPLVITADADIGITYGLFADAAGAVANAAGTALASDSGTLASNANTSTVTNLATGATAPLLIDVTAGAKLFVGGGKTSALGTISVADTAATELAADGATPVTHAVANDAGTLVLTGDFTATQDLAAVTLVPDGTYTVSSVFLDTTATPDCTTVSDATDSLTATTASWTAVLGAADDVALCMTVNGVTAIAPGSYSAVYTPTAVAGYDVTPATTLTTATLTKNGSTAIVNLALSPTGAYKNYVRVSNTTNVAGAVTITLYNDDGLSSGAFNLSGVAGEASDTLAGQASTGLMDVVDLMAAAQVASPTFALSTVSNKLRVSIAGEFVSIDAQSITTSIDGNSFSTF